MIIQVKSLVGPDGAYEPDSLHLINAETVQVGDSLCMEPQWQRVVSFGRAESPTGDMLIHFYGADTVRVDPRALIVVGRGGSHD